MPRRADLHSPLAALVVVASGLAGCRGGGDGSPSLPSSSPPSAAIASSAGAPTALPTSSSLVAPSATSHAVSVPATAQPRIIATRGEHTAYLVPALAAAPARLIAGLHGVCNPPEYACGLWAGAASRRGVLLCPSGNARCGAEAYNAPTWRGSFGEADDLLEAARSAAARELGVSLDTEGAILMGFSRGAYHALKIASAHPGRWPLLLLVEADPTLHPAALGAAGVKAVALMAGERSGQRGGMAASAKALERAGFPARMWVMPDAGHHYSANIDELMAEALDFLIAAPGAAEVDSSRSD